MNRELEFRVFDKDSNTMRYLCPLQSIRIFSDGSGWIYDSDDADTKICSFAPSYVEEGNHIETWTGLTDKNGVKIFKSDRVDAEHDETFIVEWFEDTASWILTGEQTGKVRWIENREQFKSDFHFSTNQLKVIGNIHNLNG